MKIYTRAGDTGSTSLYDGTHVSKMSAVVEALGALDELNCDIGTALAFAPDPADPGMDVLRDTQPYLLDLGTLLAYPRPPESRRLALDDSGERVAMLEQNMDAMTNAMPPLKNFILPGGTRVTSYIHQARATCRRAERRTVAILESSEAYHEISVLVCIKFLNRFSDYLFTLARFADHIAGIPDSVYKQVRTPKLSADEV